MPFINPFDEIELLSDPCKAALRAVVQSKKYRKGHFLVFPGQINDKLYYIETGLVRVFSESDSDKIITSWFAQEGGFVCSVQSFFNQKPSFESVQLVEDSQLWVISYADFGRMLVEFPELNLHFRKIYERYLVAYDARVYLLREATPIKKYEAFLKLHPKLAHRLQRKHIAQFLNINQSTLSKTPKLLKNKG